MEWLSRFDPDPRWYLWSLHSISAISLPLYLIGMACIFRVNITSSNSIYKYLLALNVTMAYLTQLSLSVGTIPMVVLPGLGGYPLGFLALLGMPSCYQCALVICLVTANGLTTVILFFYRSHVAIPFAHNLYYSLLLLFIVLGAVLPAILLGTACKTMDINKTKTEFQRECPDIFALLPEIVRNETLLIADVNAAVLYSLNYFILLVLTAVVLISAFIYRTTVMLRRKIFSQTAVIMHRTLVLSLLIQTTVYYGFFLIPVVVVLVLVTFKLALPGVANLAFVGLSLSDPAGVLALIFAHQKYRKAVFRSLYKTQTTTDGIQEGGSRERGIASSPLSPRGNVISINRISTLPPISARSALAPYN